MAVIVTTMVLQHVPLPYSALRRPKSHGTRRTPVSIKTMLAVRVALWRCEIQTAACSEVQFLENAQGVVSEQR
jgi:hypothetical protein